jgi:hypothetical protein
VTCQVLLTDDANLSLVGLPVEGQVRVLDALAHELPDLATTAERGEVDGLEWLRAPIAPWAYVVFRKSPADELEQLRDDEVVKPDVPCLYIVLLLQPYVEAAS